MSSPKRMDFSVPVFAMHRIILVTLTVVMNVKNYHAGVRELDTLLLCVGGGVGTDLRSMVSAGI